METLDSADLRMLNKILQLLKSDHGVAISARAEKLPELLEANILVLDDPVINAVWLSLAPKLSSKFSAESVTKSSSSAVDKESQKKGRYITYRGKKTWVEG